MSRSGETTLEFGGEERSFRLGIAQVRKIQEVCDAGPPELLARLSPMFMAAKQGLNFEQIVGMGLLGSWRVDDLREPILQGLLGANMPAPEAMKLVRTWVDERPYVESVVVAYKLVLASIIGAEDEAAAGEPQAAAEDSQTSPAARSDSAKTVSTPSAPPADSRPAMSTP